MPHKIITVVGARPQFIKCSVMSRLFGQTDDIEEILVHTGQHYDENMSDAFFAELGIKAPAYHLDINNASHGAMTGKMLIAIEEILLQEKPDAVMVYGDTNSTLAGAIAAVKLGIPVIHNEAGLRSYLQNQPEEINRILTDRVSSLLLSPTHTGVENLAKEGITRGVHYVGDVMYDACLYTKAMEADILKTQLQALDIEGEYVFATIHREENTDSAEQLAEVFNFIREKADGWPIVMPLHPRTKNRIERFNIDTSGIHLIPPQPYATTQALLSKAIIAVTDSGGLQKEAYFHRTPCITVRENTEWIETIEAGWHQLWKQPAFIGERGEISDYGDGHSGEKTVDIIRNFLS